MIYYLTLAVVLVGGVVSTPKALSAYRTHRHNAVMGRIAELEVSTGMGLVYAREWAESRAPYQAAPLTSHRDASLGFAYKFTTPSKPATLEPTDPMNAPVHADEQPNRNDAMSGQA